MMSPVVRGMLRRANERAMERLAERLQTAVGFDRAVGRAGSSPHTDRGGLNG